jgi:hypothetical protein
MSLRIVSVAYPFAAVGTAAVGGAEQVLHRLDEAITCAGHTSVVIAPSGSRTCGTLLQIAPAEDDITSEVRANIYRQVRGLIAKSVNEFDPHLIHMHGVDFYEYLPVDDRPVLVTLHLPNSFYPPGFSNYHALRPI